MAVCRPPQDAPPQLVRRIESEAQAISVSLHGKKLSAFAAQLGISVAYLSRIAGGHRTVPGWFTQPFCWATGTNLLAQFQALQRALNPDPVAQLAQMLREAA